MFLSRILPVALILSLTPASLAQSGTAVKRTPAKNVPAASGDVMFRSYCASCHGTTGRGDGPVASELKIPPADLTLLTARNHGQFPKLMVANAIRGDTSTPAHGSAQMPVWGTVFSQMAALNSAAEADIRIANLTKFVESLQRNPK